MKSTARLPTATTLTVYSAGPITIRFSSFRYAFPLSSLWKSKRKNKKHHTQHRVSQRDPKTVILTWRAGAVTPIPDVQWVHRAVPIVQRGRSTWDAQRDCMGTGLLEAQEGKVQQQILSYRTKALSHTQTSRVWSFPPSPICWEWKGQMAKKREALFTWSLGSWLHMELLQFYT